MNRRGFLAGILAAGVAPAAVGSGILMPVRKIVTHPLFLGLDGDYGNIRVARGDTTFTFAAPQVPPGILVGVAQPDGWFRWVRVSETRGAHLSAGERVVCTAIDVPDAAPLASLGLLQRYAPRP